MECSKSAEWEMNNFMEKKIVFRDSEQRAKYTLAYTDYGLNIVMNRPTGDMCLFCIGDSQNGYVTIQRGNQLRPFKMAYLRPKQPIDDLTYPTKRWAEMAAQLRMIKQTPFGRTLIAKPIVGLNHVNGIRILGAESDKDKAIPIVDIVVQERENANPKLSLKWNARIINPN